MTRPEAKGGNHTLATIGADGSGRRPLTDGSANDMSPSWSPDGKWIVFVRAPLMTKAYRELSDAERAALRNGREIYLIRAGGSGLRQLTHNEVADGAPFWSADSRMLAFFDDRQLKAIDIERGGIVAIADAAKPRGGDWNRAGVILFAPTPSSGLYTVRSDGTAITQVTTLAEDHGKYHRGRRGNEDSIPPTPGTEQEQRWDDKQTETVTR
jgi:Tol biopolymer transport system component